MSKLHKHESDTGQEREREREREREKQTSKAEENVGPKLHCQLISSRIQQPTK